MTASAGSPKRAMVYIDGFNLYFGLRTDRLTHLLWLDVAALSRGIVGEQRSLVAVKYFTAVVSGPLKLDSKEEAEERTKKRSRQNTYLSAIKTLSGVEVVEGKYQSMLRHCSQCKKHYYRHEEKKTDVNIASAIIRDAVLDRFDIAYLVSGDADLSPAIKVAKELAPSKDFVAAFPPRRYGNELKNVCGGSYFIKKRLLEACQLPDFVISRKSQKLSRPPEWTAGE